MSKYILADESVIKQVLAAMERVAAELDSPYTSETDEERQLRAAITALRATLAQQTLPAQEPAFHGFMSADGTRVDVCFTPNAPRSDGTYATAYYTSAPKAEPVEQMPVGWLESPHGAFRANPFYKMRFPSQLLHWQIALYATLHPAQTADR